MPFSSSLFIHISNNDKKKKKKLKQTNKQL